MNNLTKKITVSALFFALGIVLPLLTANMPQIGNMFLPMHIPVLLCGIICGWQYGLLVGLILPITRFFIFGAPPIYPIGLAMTFELAAYGLIIGIMYNKLPKKVGYTYVSLISAMIAGRVVLGIANTILYGVRGNAYSWAMFMSGAFLNAIPGIILQLILIPVIISALKKAGALK